MQFGAKPLFENVSVKFGDGNRYGLIGANGCGKSTFMKILGGELEPSAGQRRARRGRARRASCARTSSRTRTSACSTWCMMGHAEMWSAMRERDAIYANPDASEDDYMHAAELEAKFAEYGGYTAEARAGELLLGLGVPIDAAPRADERGGAGLEAARAARAGAVRRTRTSCCSTSRPTTSTSTRIRWLEDVLNRAHEHDDHHLPRPALPEPACARTWRTWTTASIRVYPGNYDDYMLASTQARKQQLQNANAKAKDRIADLQEFVRRFSRQQGQGAPGDLAHEADREDQGRGRQALQPRSTRSSASRSTRRRSCTASRSKPKGLAKATTASCSRTSTSRSKPASTSRSSARTASARRRCCAASAATCGLQPRHA